MDETTLRIQDLHTHHFSSDRVAKAVDGVLLRRRVRVSTRK